jgi:hypothetical protein
MNSDQKEQFDRDIARLRAQLSEAQDRVDASRSTKDLIQKILSGSENRAYQGGAGGRGLMNIGIDVANACGELGVEFKLNINFTKEAVNTLQRRSYQIESEMIDLERTRRDTRDQITALETEKRLASAYAPQIVQQPAVVPVQLPQQPVWLVLNATGDGTDPFTGQGLDPATLVTQDRGVNWISALEAGLAQAPVQLPTTPQKGKGKNKTK